MTKHWGIMYHMRNGAYVEGVGDRSVVRLDGRRSLHGMTHDAAAWARKHGYDGCRVARGDNLLCLFMLTAAVHPVAKEH